MEHIEIVNKTECLEIVEKSLRRTKHGEIMIKDFKVKHGSELVGFMGEYFILEVNFIDHSKSKEQSRRYFLKSVPVLNEFHRDECLRKGFFIKESRIYSEILCNIQKYAPTPLFAKCYYTRRDLVVLEDLFSSADGLRHVGKDELFTMEHSKVVLRLFSKLHAASIAWERVEKFNIGDRFKDVLIELHLSMDNEWCVAGIKGILFLAKSYNKFKTPEYEDLINNKLYTILTKAGALTDPSKKLQNVFCHRDTWDRNVFFKYNDQNSPIDCRIVDFQLSRYSVPAFDVLFFLYTTTDTVRRQQIYDECLDYYFEQLVDSFMALNLPLDLITKADFMEGCKRARLVVLILWAICEPLMKMPKGLSNKWRAEEKETFDYYMNSDRNEMFTRIMAMDSSYENIIMTPIEELLNYLLENKDLCDEFSK